MIEEAGEYAWAQGTVRFKVDGIARLRHRIESMLHPTELDMFRGGRADLIQYEGRRLVNQILDALATPDRLRVHIAHWDHGEWRERTRLFEAMQSSQLLEAVPQWLSEVDQVLRQEVHVG